MPIAYDLVAAFAVGFMGSLHCIGMCGGISTALSTAISPQKSRVLWVQLLYQFLYSSGRISSYCVAGALVGFIGAEFYEFVAPSGPSYLRIFAGVMMILLGFYLSGWWRALNYIERLGTRLWKHLARYTRYYIPVDSPYKAFLLGAIWGWLPCGLVYSALTWALGAGSAQSGALLMLCFGLGTLPALLSIGVFNHLLANFARNSLTRSIAALCIIAFGLWTIYGQLFSVIPH